MSEKITVTLEKFILVLLCIFLFAGPVNRGVAKACFSLVTFSWLILSLLKYRKKRDWRVIPHTGLNGYLLFFLIAALIATIFSFNPYESQKVLFERYIPYCVFFLITYGIYNSSRRNAYILIASFLLSGVFLGIGAVRDYILQHPQRLSTVFGMRAEVGTYLVYLIPFSFTLLCAAKKKIFIYLSLLSLILLLPVALWSGSRTTWIALAVTLLFIFSVKRIKWALLVISLIIAGIVFIPGYHKKRLKSLAHPFTATTVKARINLAISAIDMLRERPFFGAGPGMFEYRDKDPEAEKSYMKLRHLHAHNIYLDVVAEMGLIGLIAFLSIIVAFFKRFINNWLLWARSAEESRVVAVGAGAAILAMLIVNLTHSVILIGSQDALLFWFLLSIAVSEAPKNHSW